jgi:hypothetical protein
MKGYMYVSDNQMNEIERCTQVRVIKRADSMQ